MKKFVKAGALFVLLIGMNLVVVGCSGGDEGMGKKQMDSSVGTLIR